MMDSAQLVRENDSLDDPTYRAALADVLGAHALPVWGWGQRAAFETFVMSGPSLNAHVLTSGMWAEQERNLWQWEQIVTHGLGVAGDDLVANAIGDSARMADGIDTWLDLMVFAIAVKTVGTVLAGTLVESSYGPLRRMAGTIRMSAHAQALDAISALRDRSFDRHDLERAGARWQAETGALVRHIDALQPQWNDLALATPFDTSTVIASIDRAFARVVA